MQNADQFAKSYNISNNVVKNNYFGKHFPSVPFRGCICSQVFKQKHFSAQKHKK